MILKRVIMVRVPYWDVIKSAVYGRNFMDHLVLKAFYWKKCFHRHSWLGLLPDGDPECIFYGDEQLRVELGSNAALPTP